MRALVVLSLLVAAAFTLPVRATDPPCQNIYQLQQPAARKILAQEVAVAPYVVTVPVVPAAVPVTAYNVTHYYSAQEYYQNRSAMRTLVREELYNLFGSQGAPSGTTPPALTQPKEPLRSPYGRPPALLQQEGADTEIPLDIATPVLNVISKNGCLSCHSGAENKGGLRLAYTQPDGSRLLTKFDRNYPWVVYGHVSAGIMPPAAQKDAKHAVSFDDIKPLLKWARWSTINRR